jgi:hypothetical protein
LTGAELDLAAWVWSKNNEHRPLAQQLIYLGILKLTVLRAILEHICEARPESPTRGPPER